MRNTYFQFKQFIVHQEKAALKVCTDACCLGAIIAPKTTDAKSILDLGSGTGLLSLMLAQMNQASITGIDIHADSVEQCLQNFSESPWKDRLTNIHISVEDFVSPQPFDWIICNPPFFENQLNSPQEEKSLSKHIAADGWSVWIQAIAQNLSEDGRAAVLIPYFATEKVKAAFLSAALYVDEIYHLYHQENKIAFRSILIVRKQFVSHPRLQKLVIRNADQTYTTAFKQLLAPYYLHL